ncbi:MAG TPA: protein kinase [Pyrinomonadaceae bacterium]|jgi:hypothetical protein
MRLRTIIIGLLLAFIFTYTVANFYVFFSLHHMLAERGWNAAPKEAGGPELVVQVSPDGPASALEIGDEVLAINNERVERSDFKTENAFRKIKHGDNYTMLVRRGGELRELTFNRRIGAPLRLWLPGTLTTATTSLIFFLVGFAVFALQKENKQAQLLAMCLVLSASAFGLPQPFEETPAWFTFLMATGFVLRQLFPALFLHLFLVFPEPSPILRRFPRLEFYLYLPTLVLAFPVYAIMVTLWAVNPERMLEFILARRVLLASVNLIQMAHILLALLLLVLKYRKANLVSRRKLRIVLVGSLVGFVPLITWLLVLNLSHLEQVHRSIVIPGWIVVNIFFWMMPLSFAYAILRHQVIPISLMIRRSVQYLLAKNALRILLVLPLVGLLLSIALDPHRTLADILFRSSFYVYLLAIAAIALGLVFRRRLGEWVDRKFFREHYNQERVLRELIDDVKKLDSIPEMSRRVTERVNTALHPEQIYLFYREEGQRDLSLSYTSGGTSQELKIPEEFQLLHFMELQGDAQDFPFPQRNNLPQSEKEWLAQLGTNLIVPLTGTDTRLSGLLLLGQKKSEVPYTTDDRELLETLAGQIAIVYENVRLKTRVDQDRKIKHEVLSRVAGQNMNVLKECPRCGACFDIATLACTHDGAELTLSLPVERTIEGRYRLDRLIGKGGMGAVYEAADLRLNRKVAVKILMGSMFGNSEALRRFEREAQASARLHHPNITVIHDYGLLSTEGAYLVMELIEGETLGKQIKRQVCLEPQVAADIFGQLLEGLGAAHRQGIIHRDLKPENILLSKNERGQLIVRILDFGLAKMTLQDGVDANSPTAPMTTPGAVMGTFGYMSPEQLTGGEVDQRSDLFSVGVMIVEALTGQRPFNGKTYHELLNNILQKPFHLAEDSPEAQRLDHALQKCLAKDRAQRFSSAAEMQRELIPAIQDYPLPTPRQPASLDADTIILN